MLFHMPTCGACKTCEIVCSYHHTGTFNPSISSIKVLNNEECSGYSVLLIEDYDGVQKRDVVD
jgi:Fe-S-cluster-containing hydrogenase component 2